jgi:hypothetical protein
MLAQGRLCGSDRHEDWHHLCTVHIMLYGVGCTMCYLLVRIDICAVPTDIVFHRSRLISRPSPVQCGLQDSPGGSSYTHSFSYPYVPGNVLPSRTS